MTSTATVLSFVCLGLLAVAHGEIGTRIVGGQNAQISEFPYQVSLRLRGRHFCGGSIIGDKHILTAAHCIRGIVTPPYSDMLVFTGSSLSSGNSGKSYRVKRVDVHEGYLGTEASSYKDDVAVITLGEKIAFNANTRQIELASREVGRGENAIISGWGIRRYPSNAVSTQLQKASMRILPNTDCGAYMPARLYPGHVCAFQRKGVGACSGDSGGPLAVNGQVVGIASWVVPCAEGYPDVYTKVYAYKDWIKRTMARSL